MTDKSPTTDLEVTIVLTERERRHILDRLNLPYDQPPPKLGTTNIPPRPFLKKGVKDV